MPEQDFRYFEFGEFRLDAERRVLRRNGDQVHLSPRIFDLLRVMVANSGRILTHDELLDLVWDGAFVEQGNLKRSIFALRQALGETPGDNEFIVTVPRKGYRFTAPVRPLAADAEAVLYRETRSVISVEEEIEEDDSPSALHALTDIAPKPAKRRLTSARLAVLAGLALLAASAIAVAAWWHWSKPPRRFSADGVQITKLTSLGNVAGAAISADGKYLLYAVNNERGGSLWARQIATGSARQITLDLPASFYGFNLTPDDEYVYYILNHATDPSQSGLYKIPFFGGKPERIVDGFFQGPYFSPDGTRMALRRYVENADTEIVTMNLDGGDQRTVVSRPPYRITSFGWSPDGRGIMFVTDRDAEKRLFGIREVSLDNAKETVIMPEQERPIGSAIWLPDKSALLLRVREPNAELFQLWQYFPGRAEWQRVTNDDNSYTEISLTRDGRSIAAVTLNELASIWVSSDGAAELKPIMTGVKNIGPLAWTGDGRLVYDDIENRQEAIWIVPADGGDPQRLTPGNDGLDLAPAVSDDGRSITFSSIRSGERHIWRMDLDGKHLTQLTKGSYLGIDSKLLTDGQTVITALWDKTQAWRLFRQVGDSTPVTITDRDTGDFDVSPDEKLLAVELKDEKTGIFRVYVYPINGGEPLHAFDFENRYRTMKWTRDGKALVWVHIKGDSSELVLQPIDGSAPHTIGSYPAETIFGFDWSFDGKRLAVVRGKQPTDAVMIQAGS